MRIHYVLSRQPRIHQGDPRVGKVSSKKNDTKDQEPSANVLTHPKRRPPSPPKEKRDRDSSQKNTHLVMPPPRRLARIPRAANDHPDILPHRSLARGKSLPRGLGGKRACEGLVLIECAWGWVLVGVKKGRRSGIEDERRHNSHSAPQKPLAERHICLHLARLAHKAIPLHAQQRVECEMFGGTANSKACTAPAQTATPPRAYWGASRIR
jgi:hypothetical protein